MKFRLLLLLSVSLILHSCSNRDDGKSFEFTAGDMRILIDKNARITEFYGLQSQEDYLHADSATYLIQMRFHDNIIPPESAIYKPDEGMIYFYFTGDREVKVKVMQQDNYLSFELFNIRSTDKPDLIVWGPLYTNINETIGETVGVVRNHDFAIGIQSLNPKTMGGYPWLENDVMPEMDYFDQEDYTDLKKGGIAHTLYRIEAARPVGGGSVLHAYCRNRYADRSVSNWGYTNYSVKAYEDLGLMGSAIALYGCPPEQVLSTIADIELTEGLPHPELKGEWSKIAREAAAAYMIMGFGEEDFDRALAYTEQAGLKYLYHSGPFESWGHFVLNKNFFPAGREGLKACVEKAKEKGISLGVHTLSNFITTNDAYVTPVPDARLAEVGYTLISTDIVALETEIIIDDPARFNQFKNNHLKAVRIGNEIIRYAAVTETEPWTLFDCQRGAFGTEASPHASQDTIFKLSDHGYKVFLSNPELTFEIAENIAALLNETGIRQISFDGLEGCRSTGLGNYGEILFTTHWYDQLNDDIRSHYIADASRSSHYFWHIFTRMNWGEPWYAGFRESQTQYRLKNQKYFDRNYIPNMLGWFLMKPETSIEDIEWLLARSAAFDAGYSFVTSYDALEKNGFTNEILAAIALWEEARMQAVFSTQQKKAMEDVNNEFHLRQEGDKLYLSRIYTHRLKHENRVRQPGEPVTTSLEFENAGEEQIVHFILSAKKTGIINPQLEFDGNRLLTIPVKLNDGEHLKFDGQYANVYSSNWQMLKSISLNVDLLKLTQGKHTIEVSSEFTGTEGEMAVELRLMGATEIIENP